MALISRVKRDVVDILRKSIDMLGKYSSSYLPVDAKVSVRSFILGLPSRLVFRTIFTILGLNQSTTDPSIY